MTVDPDRDTPSWLAAYQPARPRARRLDAADRLTPALAVLWKQLGVYSRKLPEDTPRRPDILRITLDDRRRDWWFSIQKYRNDTQRRLSGQT
jgi:cytochrome oxidase Cu insertion factor (SCO1/SenC/PrrC family)